MSGQHVASRSAGTELVDIVVLLPEIWTANELGADARAETEAELIALLTDKVDDPEDVAKSSMDEFLQQVGGGSAPLLLASFREEMDDESILSASLVVTKNDLGGSLDPWREAYADATEITIMDEPALRTFEQTTVNMADVFDEPITACTWRYLMPFDARSLLMFTFSSPNAELAESLVEHFDEIMTDVHIVETSGSAPTEAPTPL